MTQPDRIQQQAAEEICRLVGLEDSDNLSSYLDPSPWNGQAKPNLRFKLLVNRNPVDRDGNVRQKDQPNFEPVIFNGPEGLVQAWALIADMETRAASLGIEIELSIEYDLRVQVTRSWRAFKLPNGVNGIAV